MEAAQIENMTVESAPVKARWRPRFSLGVACLAFLLVSSALLLVLTHQDLKALRAENKELKTQLGILSISEPDKVHILQVPVLGSHEWHWRLYFPKGTKYKLCAIFRSEPKIPAKADFECKFDDTSDQFSVRAAIKKDDKGNWKLYAEYPGGGMQKTPGAELKDLLDNNSGSSQMCEHTEHATVIEPQQAFRLMTMDLMPGNVTTYTHSSAQSGPGVTFWLEREK